MENCTICGNLISENTPTIKITYGFGVDLVMHHIILHLDCGQGENLIERLLTEFEVQDDF